MGELMGVHRNTIRAWEEGERPITDQRVNQYIAITKMPEWWFTITTLDLEPQYRHLHEPTEDAAAPDPSDDLGRLAREIAQRLDQLQAEKEQNAGTAEDG